MDALNKETAPAERVMTLDAAVAWRRELARKGGKLVVTNGCFDILHRGHAEYLAEAAKTGDAMLVLVNSDSSVRRLKGDSRPVNDQFSRAVVLCSLRAVDAAVIFDSVRCSAELAALKPDVYVKGGDYTIDKLDPEERAALLECGAQIVFKPFVNGFSTTGTIEKLKEVH